MILLTDSFYTKHFIENLLLFPATPGMSNPTRATTSLSLQALLQLFPTHLPHAMFAPQPWQLNSFSLLRNVISASALDKWFLKGGQQAAVTCWNCLHTWRCRFKEKQSWSRVHFCTGMMQEQENAELFHSVLTWVMSASWQFVNQVFWMVFPSVNNTWFLGRNICFFYIWLGC